MSPYVIIVAIMLGGAAAIFAGAVLYVRALLWCGTFEPPIRTLLGIALWLAFAALTVLPLFAAISPTFRGEPESGWFRIVGLLLLYVAAVTPGFLHIRHCLPALRRAGFFRK